MSDDELDPELIAAFRQSQLAAQLGSFPSSEDTGVLNSAKFICDNSIDVALDMVGTKSAAEIIYNQMVARDYSPKTWSSHELHPEAKDEATVRFIFTMDLLNFSFFSDRSKKEEMYAVEYRGKRWNGYWGLVAALQRALDEGIKVTDPMFWHDEEECTEDVYRHVFRSATDEEMPMLKERIVVLQEAAEVLCKVIPPIYACVDSVQLTVQNFESSVLNLIEQSNQSAAVLVNLLAEYFPSFRDECKFEGRKVRFLKRAQIFVADLWAAFEGESYGEFHDIDKITMFAGLFIHMDRCLHSSHLSQITAFLRCFMGWTVLCIVHHWRRISAKSKPLMIAALGRLNCEAAAYGALNSFGERSSVIIPMRKISTPFSSTFSSTMPSKSWKPLVTNPFLIIEEGLFSISIFA